MKKAITIVLFILVSTYCCLSQNLLNEMTPPAPKTAKQNTGQFFGGTAMQAIGVGMFIGSGYEAWRHGGMEAWRHGGMETCNPGTLELWNLGTLELWNLGTLELWNLGTLELWNFGTCGLWLVACGSKY